MSRLFTPCAVVPSRNHWRALPTVVAELRRQSLPVLIIDDGSDPAAAAAIAALDDPAAGVRVVRRPRNGGKGAAVMDGFALAAEAGYSHVVQVDADGQHDLAALPALIDQARRHPHAVVSGAPRYDSTMPAGRRIGRHITHFWVRVETLSGRLTDTMCGFRVYPLAACLALMAKARPGERMDFDIEIMVRLFWQGVPPAMVPVRVIYPPDNSSNFDLWRDNARISLMHARLVLTMMWRLPAILRHRPPRLAGDGPERPTHWAGLAERGAAWGLSLVALLYAVLGRRLCGWALAPIALSFYFAGGPQRRASQAYLGRVLGRRPTWRDGWRHFLDFAHAALDTFAAWAGRIPAAALRPGEPDLLACAATDRRGALLVVSHHGSAELARALMEPALRRRLTVLVHTRHAENYNRLLARFRGGEAGRMIQVTDIGPETAIALGAAIERGEWVAVAGDRVPVLSAGRVARVPFLGGMADFSHGPWLLAALLDCPVHLLFCRRRQRGQWALTLEPFAARISLPRGRRDEALSEYAAAYAARLERECRAAPWQWYNFFDFWAEESRR